MRHFLFFAISLTLSSARLIAGEAHDLTTASAELRDVIPRVAISINEQLGTARHIASPDGFLSGPAGLGKAVRPLPGKAALAGPHQAVRNFMNAWPQFFGGDESLLSQAVIIRDDITEHSGLRTTVWQQLLDDIPVYGGDLLAHTTKRDELISIGSGFVPALDRSKKASGERRALMTAPHHSVEDVVRVVLTRLGATDTTLVLKQALNNARKTHYFTSPGAAGDMRAELLWFPHAVGSVRLAWQVTAQAKSDDIMYAIVVDAATLNELRKIRLTSYGFYDDKKPPRVQLAEPTAVKSPALGKDRRSYAHGAMASEHNRVSKAVTPLQMRVFPGISPAVSTHDLLTNIYINPLASPDGWIDAAKQTIGNNVDAHTDLNSDNIIDGVDLPRPQGTGNATVTFDFPANLTQEPDTYRKAAVVNLFYWCNIAHDRLYELGFTETSGNFQKSNFGRGGLENDAVLADAQDGDGIPGRVNNANMATPLDGIAPRMQMYLWTFSATKRDSDLDASVIIHEYVHGLTHRLIGGGADENMEAIQTGGMGEGWSDFYALSLLSKPTDNHLAPYPIGDYLINDMAGIREQLYCVEPKPTVTFAGVNKSVNTMTFNTIRNYLGVHDIGTVWCQMLWECRGELIAKFGAEAGNMLMLRLVTDGLKLTPKNPSFVEARDAIIRADLVANNGANSVELWRAFSKRGLGRAAVAGHSGTLHDVAESFENSSLFRVDNPAGLIAYGRKGKPYSFNPYTVRFTLHNPGNLSLNWNVSTTQNWISFNTTSGSLAAGASATVFGTLNYNAITNLGVSVWRDTIVFTDTTHALTVVRPLTLRILPSYTISSSVSDTNWISTVGHTPKDVLNDSEVSLEQLPFIFPFYEQKSDAVFISANGLLRFAGFQESLVNDYSRYNVILPTRSDLKYGYGAPTNIAAAMWRDFKPTVNAITFGVNGTVGNRVAVITWTGVIPRDEIPNFYLYDHNTIPMTFQIALEEATGDVVMNYKEVQAKDTIRGSGREATVGIEESTGVVADSFSYGTASLSNNLRIRYHPNDLISDPDNAPPTIATTATASAINAAGTSCTLSVLAADDAGENNLTYTWSHNGSPTSLFTFSANGTNAAKNTTVTFTKVGTFLITVTATDAHGLSATSTVSVTVPAVLSGLSVTPATWSLPNWSSYDFAVGGLDQFGDAMTSGEPTVTWSVSSGAGTINSSGLFTANGQGSTVIQAQNGTLTDTATITVTNGMPIIASAITATPNPVTADNSALAVLGNDDGGESALIYTWSTVGTVPAPVVFIPNGTNSAKNSTATFTKAGTYPLRVTILDAQGGSIYADITVIVNQTSTGNIALDPRVTTLAILANQTFVARTSDQFGDPILSSAARTVTWSSTVGSITPAGVFTAPSNPGTATITAVENISLLTTTATVTISIPSDRFGGGPTSSAGNNCGLGGLAAFIAMAMMMLWWSCKIYRVEK
jgi:outer membrane lipoprotein-sorting protein